MSHTTISLLEMSASGRQPPGSFLICVVACICDPLSRYRRSTGLYSHVSIAPCVIIFAVTLP